MPDSVPSFNESVDWSSSDMGIIGAGISALNGGDGALGKTLESGILSNAGNILGGGIGAILGGGSLGATVLGTILGGEGSVQTAVETLSSSKANPFKEQTFQGIGFRSFSFSFNMRARNQDEVESIREIIKAFRAYSKPSFKDGNAGVFKYPHEFLIEFLKVQGGGYVKNEYLPELKYCVCNNVTTNYTSVNWKSFENGAPVDINLSLSFQETEIVTQEDILGDPKVGRFKGSEKSF